MWLQNETLGPKSQVSHLNNGDEHLLPLVAAKFLQAIMLNEIMQLIPACTHPVLPTLPRKHLYFLLVVS